MADARKGILLLFWLLAACGWGCHRQSAESARPTTGGRTEFTAPAWGNPADGLQCRLRPVKRLWQAGETPVFKVDLRNQGKRIFALPVEPLQPQRVAIDRQWLNWPAPASSGVRMTSFGPGSDLADLPLSLPPEAARRLTEGRHIIQIAFVFEGIEVRSAPLEIEIVN
ncbi:MAG: hypothetical protein JW993_15060 [Sedimentisphaerales bacterium]|nr:hypothetical protein [Sedimentisphaerales bacterium]